MNNVIAQSLVSILYPTANSKKSEIGLNNTSLYSYGADNILGEITEHLLMSEYHRLLTVKNIPQCTAKATEFNADLWPGMTSRIS